MKTSKEQLSKHIGKNKVRYNTRTERFETAMNCYWEEPSQSLLHYSLEEVKCMAKVEFCDIQGGFLL